MKWPIKGQSDWTVKLQPSFQVDIYNLKWLFYFPECSLTARLHPVWKFNLIIRTIYQRWMWKPVFRHTVAGGTCRSVLFGIPHTDAAQHFSKKRNQKRRHHLSVLLIRMKSPKHKYRKNIEYILFFFFDIKFSLIFNKKPIGRSSFSPVWESFCNKCFCVFAVLSVAWMDFKHCFWRHCEVNPSLGRFMTFWL